MSKPFAPSSLFAAAAAVALIGCADAPLPTATLPAGVTPSVSATLAAGSSDIVPLPQGRVIVRFRQGSTVGLAIADEARQRAAAAFAQRHGARIDRQLGLARTWVLETTPGNEDALAAALAGEGDVEFAEVDRPILLQPCETGDCLSSNDPFRGYKWDLHNTGFIVNNAGTVLGATGKVDADIDWLEAYDALGGDFTGTATIGIVDTGILPTHQDLVGRVVGALNHASGYAATLTQDRSSHGTHVAGIAAARTNNAAGVMGVGYGSNIRLLNAKACEWYQFPDASVAVACASSSVANAIVWATDNGANVINLSLGGATPSAAQQAALQYARSQNVLPVCATGNNGTTGAISYPARYPECVAVGATNWADDRAAYSNAGDEIELSAPGGDGASLPAGNSLVLAPVPSLTLTSPPGTIENNASYGWKAGTSMASPQVAGLAGILYATGLSTPDAVVTRMRETVDDLGATGWDALFGAGRINACRALDPAAVRIELPGSLSMQDGANAVIPVVLFGGPRFQVDQFDVANLTLGNGSAPEAGVILRGIDYRSAIADVDGDGVLDLTLKFSRADLLANGDLQQGVRTMVLSGNVGCRRVQGSQTVRVNR